MNTDKKQLLRELKARLDWYTMEASDEEFDASEVQALVQLIHVLEGEGINASVEPTESGKAPDFEQFKEYMEKKQALQEKVCAKEESSREIVRNRFGRKGGFWVAAAIMILLFAGGSIGVVSAQKEGGFFHWLKRDETGEQLVISPQDNEDASLNEVRFFSESEVPTEMCSYLIAVNEMESLKDYELKYIDIGSYLNCTQVQYGFEKSDGEQVIISALHYQDKLMLKQENYDDYKLLKEEILGEKQLNFFSRENSQGETAYLISFYHQSAQYSVSGMYSLESVEVIAKDCVKIVAE